MEEASNLTSVTPVPPPIPKRSRFPTKRILIIVVTLGSFFVFALVVGSYIYNLFDNYLAKQEAARKKAMERFETQIKMRRVMQQKIEDLRVHGTSLPPCPLLYPILNEKGKVTPLGSYLSAFAMRQATYLPQSVFQLPDTPIEFNQFDLFEPWDLSKSTYRAQLPYNFDTKDFGEGTLKKTVNGYKITLRFWGTHPGKKYQKAFKKKDLHLSIGWMANCLQDYVGFKPTSDEIQIMSQPIFQDDKDLIRAAAVESFFRNGGERLVLGWDKILSKNPENPYLITRKRAILESLDGRNYLNLFEPLVLKHPNGSYYKYITSMVYTQSKKYDEAIDLVFSELKRDDNNSIWYKDAIRVLEAKDDWIDAYQLLKNWTQKYPDNSNALLEMADFMKDWAWDIRGSGMANTVPKKAWPIFQKRIDEGYSCIQKAMQLTPDYWLTWANGLEYGRGASLNPGIVSDYFQKTIELNPADSSAYDDYLEYLKPKWFGSEEEMMNFANRYASDRPYLLVDAAEEELSSANSSDGADTLSPEVRKAFLNSPYWPIFEKNMQLNLKQSPYYLSGWETYLTYAEITGKLDDVYKLAKEVVKKNPELAALPSALINQYHIAHYGNLDDNHLKSAYWLGQDTLKETVKEALEMEKLDPDNWYWANKAICYQIHTSQVDAAIKSYKLVGEEHWDPNICEKSDWETVKNWAIATPTTVPGPTLLHRDK
jgi:hypothetical protein